MYHGSRCICISSPVVVVVVVNVNVDVVVVEHVVVMENVSDVLVIKGHKSCYMPRCRRNVY